MKKIIFAIIILSIVLGGIVWLTQKRMTPVAEHEVSNVNMVSGTQQIAITAKGGYAPRLTIAKAGVPTVINVSTKGTFDCSSSLSIPSIGYTTNLPPTGETTIDVPPQAAGTKLRGICAMGMYNFVVDFK